MKTKEIAFTLPVMISIYECTFFTSNLKQRLLKLAPFMVTLLIIPLTVMKLEALFPHAASSSVEQSMDLVNYNGVTRHDYLVSQFRVIVTYIRLLLLPVNQHPDHFVPLYHSLFQPEVALSLLLITALFATGVYLLFLSKKVAPRYRLPVRLIAFGIIWFFVTISVESSVIPLDDLLTEQRVYLPSFGFFLAGVTSLALFCDSRCRHSNSVFALLSVVLVMTLSITAYTRNRLWLDPLALWSDSAQKSPRSVRSFQNLGAHYFGKQMFQESIDAFLTAQRLDPKKIEPTLSLANVYLALNRFAEAETEYQKVINLLPTDIRLYDKLAHAYIIQNKHDQAVSVYLRALERMPDNPAVINKLRTLTGR